MPAHAVIAPTTHKATHPSPSPDFGDAWNVVTTSPIAMSMIASHGSSHRQKTATKTRPSVNTKPSVESAGPDAPAAATCTMTSPTKVSPTSSEVRGCEPRVISAT